MREYALGAGCLFLFLALLCDQVTLASGRYEVILSFAIALSLAAIGTFVFLWKEPSRFVARIGSLIAILTYLLVILDAAARLSHTQALH